MTITFVKENMGIEFENLVVGDVFAEVDDPEDVYIKTAEFATEFEVINAVYLKTGALVHISPCKRVELLEAELLVGKM